MRKAIKGIICLVLTGAICIGMLSAMAFTEYSDKNTVKLVQQVLNNAGYDCGTPDGVAGKKTQAAIQDYQSTHGLPVTGVIDDALLQAMKLPQQALASTQEQAGEQGQAAPSDSETQSSDLTYKLYAPDYFVSMMNDMFKNEMTTNAAGFLDKMGTNPESICNYYALGKSYSGQYPDSETSYFHYRSQHTEIDIEGIAKGDKLESVSKLMLTFKDKDEKKLDQIETYYLKQFVSLCDLLLVPEPVEGQLDSIYALFPVGDDGFVSMEEWDEFGTTLYQASAYDIMYFYMDDSMYFSVDVGA